MGLPPFERAKHCDAALLIHAKLDSSEGQQAFELTLLIMTGSIIGFLLHLLPDPLEYGQPLHSQRGSDADGRGTYGLHPLIASRIADTADADDFDRSEPLMRVQHAADRSDVAQCERMEGRTRKAPNACPGGGVDGWGEGFGENERGAEGVGRCDE